MAFSTNQLQYLKSIIAANADDYANAYYVAWNEAVSSSSSDPDLHIIISTEPILFNDEGLEDYNSNGAALFTGSGSAVRYDVITGNPSGYNPDTSNRIEITGYGTGESWQLMIPGYDTISTNCDYETIYGVAIFGDTFSSEGGYDYAQREGQGIALGVIGVLILLTVFFSCFFRR